jgi:hypothetical protein
MGKGGGKGSAGLVVPRVVTHDGCAKFELADGTTCPVKRSHNFCAGPAMLDSAAMFSMWADFLSWQDSGVSLIEMSQRDVGGPVQTVVADAADNIRKLLAVPSNYRTLLFQVRFKASQYCTALNRPRRSHAASRGLSGTFVSITGLRVYHAGRACVQGGAHGQFAAVPLNLCGALPASKQSRGL